MGLDTVPRHFLKLDCDLVQGIVPVGVRPKLPIEGIAMVLGNDLAGSHVWANVPPPPVVISKPLVSEVLETNLDFPEVYPACAVTHAQSRKEAPFVSDTGHNDSTVIDHVVHLPDLPSSVSKDEWVSSQRPDPSLASLWKEVLKIEKVRDVAQGYFVKGDLLYA